MSFIGRIPAVLCGRTLAIGQPVSQLLLPEYEVVHFIQSYEAAQADLPHVLAGRDPRPATPNDIGTHDYSRPARVVIFGRGFHPDQVEALKKQCADSLREPVAWVAGDPAKVPVGPVGPDYSKIVTEEVKKVLAKWRDEGGVEDAILLF